MAELPLPVCSEQLVGCAEAEPLKAPQACQVCTTIVSGRMSTQERTCEASGRKTYFAVARSERNAAQFFFHCRL